MKNVYEVLRQKELEASRVKQEVDALRIVAPLLSETEDDNQPTLQRAVNDNSQKVRTAREGNKKWP
jgi:hypothetical protein